VANWMLQGALRFWGKILPSSADNHSPFENQLLSGFVGKHQELRFAMNC
jgi:hypothetical protein